MNYQTNNNFKGIMNLYTFSPESAAVMRPLFEKVMRDPDFSPIPVGYRELIAAKCASSDESGYQYWLHKSIGEVHLGEGEFSRIWDGKFNIEEPEKVNGIMNLVHEVLHEGWSVSQEFIDKEVKASGISDREVHDTLLIMSLAHMWSFYMIVSGVESTVGLTRGDFQTLAGYIIAEGYDNGQTKGLNC